jgi:hypothetical protein
MGRMSTLCSLRYVIHSHRVKKEKEGDVGLFDLLVDMTR